MSALIHGDLAARLRALTPARVGLGCTGVSQRTRDLLDFQKSHALARDAVHAHLDVAGLAADLRAISGTSALCLRSSAANRTIYLQRPDLGRALSTESETDITEGGLRGFDLSIVIADGLSALAVERHSAPLLRILLPMLNLWTLAPICVVEQGRVAIGDPIGEILGAKLCLMLIGERPGLSSPDSLGAYITWNPQPGRTDAERNCISNIRVNGLGYEAAANQIIFLLREGRQRKLTGVGLKLSAPELAERTTEC
ncbi:MAG: ethanolamine ammonia-lyase subunit EutC [Acidobacteriota bacterium]|nr:ethanolamine ammonia-lyase subunit EutC [Acidobacteriota bacterium]